MGRKKTRKTTEDGGGAWLSWEEKFYTNWGDSEGITEWSRAAHYMAAGMAAVLSEEDNSEDFESHYRVSLLVCGLDQNIFEWMGKQIADGKATEMQCMAALVKHGADSARQILSTREDLADEES